jgi:hypothetical protein
MLIVAKIVLRLSQLMLTVRLAADSFVAPCPTNEKLQQMNMDIK